MLFANELCVYWINSIFHNFNIFRANCIYNIIFRKNDVRVIDFRAIVLVQHTGYRIILQIFSIVFTFLKQHTIVFINVVQLYLQSFRGKGKIQKENFTSAAIECKQATKARRSKLSSLCFNFLRVLILFFIF